MNANHREEQRIAVRRPFMHIRRDMAIFSLWRRLCIDKLNHSVTLKVTPIEAPEYQNIWKETRILSQETVASIVPGVKIKLMYSAIYEWTDLSICLIHK